MTRYPIAADGFGPGEIAAAISVLQSGRYTMGDEVRAFERDFAAYVGAKHAVMVNSGSSANLLMVDALMERNGGHLKPGDGVLVPALAWSTTVAPIIQLGLRPVFCDVYPDTLEMVLPSNVAGIKAVMPVHVLGRACDMDSIVRFCDSYRLTLIEDCCESFGARFNGKHVGTFGQTASHSFFFSHHITTMEGGMVTTDSARTADTLRALRAHGWVRDRSDSSAWVEERPLLDRRFLFSNLGYNVRPTEIQGAMGVRQLQRADSILADRRALAARVTGLLKGHPELSVVGATEDPLRHSWMAIVLRSHRLSGKAMQERMEALGVDTRSVIAGNLLRHPAFENYGDPEDFPGAEIVMSQCFMIGCHPSIEESQIQVLERAFDALRQEAA